MPSNTADGYIYIDLQLRQDEFEKRLAQVEGKTSSFASKIKNTLLAIGIGAMAKQAAGYIYNVGAEFEAAMSRVQAISGATGKDLEALTEKAKELGASTKYSAPEVAAAMEEMAKAGWNTQQILEGMEGVLDAAAASGEGLATTSTIVADAITGFGLAAKDSTHVADLLTQAANAGTIDIADLGETFKYIAPVARTMGLSIEDVTTAVSAMSMAGIKGSQAGTSLRTVLTRMVKPTEAVSVAMNELGINLTNQDGSFKSLDQIVKEIRKSFSGLTDEQKTYYATILAGQEGMSGLLALLNLSQEEYDAIAESMDNCNGVAKKTAAIMQDNLSSAIEQLGGAVDSLAIEIFESMSEQLKNLAFIGADAIEQLTNGLITGGVSGMAIAGANIVGSLISSFLTQAPLLLSQGMSMVAQLSQGLVMGIPNLVSSALTMIQTFATNLANQAPVIIQKGFEMLSNLVQGILNALPVMIQQLPQIITTFANIINDNFPTILMKGAELLLQFIKGILSAIPTLIANIPQIIQAIISVILAYNWLNLGKQIIQFFGNGISKMVSFVSSRAGGIFNTVVNALKNLPQTLMNLAKNMISKFGKSITTGTVKGAVKGVFNAVVNGLKSLPSQMVNIGKNLIKGLWNGINDMVGWIGNKIKSFGKGVLDGIKSFFGIHSPSKLMANEVGKYLPKGIAVGFEAEMPNTENDMISNTRKMIDDFKYEVNNSANRNQGNGPYNPGPDIPGNDPIDYTRLGNEMVNAFAKSGVTVSIDKRKAGRILKEVQ